MHQGGPSEEGHAVHGVEVPRFVASYLYDAMWSDEDKSHELLAPSPDVFEGDIRETRWLRVAIALDGWIEE